ncbi:aarF domain-containing kinase [Nematocida major]|uniref:aarF domain-containing kinase n=1 Tax=Nematocida major TaxID=1912982 RepID=UPI002008D511|nr:aarF domain-containing kinase [Nematocida major]KAH9385176.1 aarF domain-containing kinase [Nematocida major]
MKCRVYGFFPPPLCSSVESVRRTIHPVKAEKHAFGAHNYVCAAARAVKFFLFDASLCVCAMSISKTLGAEALFRAFTSNGPLIMKLGQFLSTRADILPEEALLRLKAIQSMAPSSVPGAADPLDMLRKETGVALPRSSLKGKIGAGCISQVYRVQIGEKDYALKIIDRSVREQIHADLVLFQMFSAVLGFGRFYREFMRNMGAQMDLNKERENTERFRRNFAMYRSPAESSSAFTRIVSKLTDTSFIFPKPIAATESLLLTEYWKGGEVGRAHGEGILFMFLKMLFKDRFVHSDLHPGNLAVLDAHGGRGTCTGSARAPSKHHTIIVYDTGLSHELTQAQCKNLKDLSKEVLLGRKERALSLVIDRNRLNQHTCEEKRAFLKSAAAHWERLRAGAAGLPSGIFRGYALTQRHNVFLDSAYTNIMMSVLYVQDHIRDIKRLRWPVALKSGLSVDYVELFARWRLNLGH